MQENTSQSLLSPPACPLPGEGNPKTPQDDILAMKDGCISPDSPAGRTFGFTTDKFTPFSYLWKKGDAVYISMISAMNPGKGNFKGLVQTLVGKGLTVKIPTPIGKMEDIVRKNYYTPTLEDTDYGSVEVWVLNP